MIDVTHDGDDWRTRNFQLACVLGFQNLFNGLVGDLFFVADDGGGGAELGSHILHHLRIERLVHRHEDTTHQQRGNQVLGANIQLFRQVLDADSLGDRDFPCDRQRFPAILHPAITWRRHKALHRAFLRLGILRTSAAAARCSTLRTRSFPGRRCTAGTRRTTRARRPKARPRTKTGACARRTCTSRPCVSARRSAGGMLGTRAGSNRVLPRRPTRRPLGISPRAAGRPVAIENGLSALNAGPRCRYPGVGGWDGGSNYWRLVNRAGSRLGHNHPPGR